jgi:ribosomal protein L37AE/L43A
MASVDQLGITTVINKEEFKSNVLVKDCPVVGRSLVAKRPLVPGDVVLVEEPLIKYDLKPTCRSTKSPYYSKKLWNLLVSMVHDEEEKDTEDQIVVHEQVQELHVDDDQDSYDDYSDEDESSDEEEEEVNTDSDFCPGVPAAIIAYLEIHPPSSFTNVRKKKLYQQSDFDFFYYPNTDTEPAWLDHKTIKLIHTVTQKVVDTVPLYAHVDPFDLRSFVLKIYSNAHTVSLPRSRTLPTHSSRKARRSMYKSKFGDNATYWGEDAVEPANTPTIALLRWGSKFAHSCSPNMFLRFEPARNAMVFTVIRPLNEGDVLSFSYLPEDDSTVGGLVCGAVSDRRAKLQKFKFFECTCERCVDWDWSRGVTCKECNQPSAYRNDQGLWACFDCSANFADAEAAFIGDREENVQRMVMGFAARVNGNRRMGEGMMRMLEPYLMDLLDPAPEKNQIAVPKNHWTFGVIHSLLAHYHLTLFPQSFGKGLASQLGLTVKGLEEALVYIEFLNSTIRTHAKSESASQGNPMAAFFAGWRVLALVIDLIMDSTENKYANVSYERDDLDSSDSDLDDEAIVNDKNPVVDQTKEPVLIPLAEDWIAPVTKIADIAYKEWTPLIEQIFQSHQSVVVEDMLSQIKSFAVRIQQTSALTIEAQ